MTDSDARKRAKEHLDKARSLLSESSQHVQRFRSKDALIAHIRMTRAKLWETKLAVRPR